MVEILSRGQPFAVVADIMRWSPATAVRMVKRYGHIGPSAKRSAMAALDSPPTAPQPDRAAVSDSSGTLVRGPGTLQ